MTTTAPTPHADRRWLDFVDAQSYGKSIGPMPARFTPPPVPGLAGGERALSWDAAGLVHAVAWPPPASPPASPPVAAAWPRVQALLYGAFGTLRHEPSQPFQAHRAYPSARCLFPVSAYVLDAAGAGRYEPTRHALQAVAGAPAIAAPPGGVTIALVGHLTAIPGAYGPLRHALTVLEAGHALRAAVQSAEALALAPRIDLDFDDEAVLARLGLPRDGGHAPLALIALAGDRAGFARPATPRPPPATDDVAALERASWTTDARRAAPRSPRPVRPLPPDARAVGDEAAAPRPLADVLYARSAGRGASGLSARRATLPGALVAAAAAAALRPVPGHGGEPPTGVRVLVVTERIDGVADGLHELDPVARALVPRRAGRLLGEIQRGFSYPAEAVNVGSMNLAWLLVVDYAAVLDAHGPRGLRRVHLALGWIAQGIAVALAAGGVFARPVRSYHEAVLDGVLGLPAHERVGYQLLCGVGRFTDVLFDLRPQAGTARPEACP